MVSSLNRLAIDPGVSTGLAMRLDGEFSVWLVEKGNAREVLTYITPKLDEVIYERFATSQRVDHYGLLTVEMCGAIQGRVWAVNEFNRFCSVPGPHECPGGGKQITLVRQEPQNRYAFVEEARELVLKFFKDIGEKPDKQIMDDGVSATAHLLCREQLGDNVRSRQYGRGISNA